jgi:hypothetical protein
MDRRKDSASVADANMAQLPPGEGAKFQLNHDGLHPAAHGCDYLLFIVQVSHAPGISHAEIVFIE